jgi:hypothetical protein
MGLLLRQGEDLWPGAVAPGEGAARRPMVRYRETEVGSDDPHF